MTNVGATRGKWTAATAVLLCVFVASMAVEVAVAAAESEPPVYDGAMTFPNIEGPSSPDEFSWRVDLSPNQTLLEESETKAEVRYEDGVRAFTISAPPAHDANGMNVPTTLRVSDADVLTLVVHDREGNSAAAGAPFEYPIIAGEGWEGEFWTEIVQGPPDEHEIAEQLRRVEESLLAKPLISEANPPLPATEHSASPTPCMVPSLNGLDLHAAKVRLRADHCAIGQVHLAGDVTAGKGKVVKQFHPAGSELAAGAPIAVKLGSS